MGSSGFWASAYWAALVSVAPVEVALQQAALEPRGVKVRRGHVVERHDLGAGAERHAQRARVRPGAAYVRAELLSRVLKAWRNQYPTRRRPCSSGCRRARRGRCRRPGSGRVPAWAAGLSTENSTAILDAGDGEAVEEGVGGDGVRERGRPALQDVWVCERGVDGHVLPSPVVRREQEHASCRTRSSRRNRASRRRRPSAARRA